MGINDCDDPDELSLPKLCHATMGFVSNLSMGDTAVMVYGRYLKGLVPFNITPLCVLEEPIRNGYCF